MKKIISFFIATCSSCGLIFSQDIAITLQYKAGTDSFYVYMTPTFSTANFNMGTSQVTIVYNSVFPISNPPSGSIAVTGVAGGGWAPTDYAQESGGAHRKFVSFLTTGAPVGTVNAGQKVLLFRYRVNGGDCVSGSLSRVFANGIDPIDPTGVFQDFTAFINVNGVDHNTSNANISLLSCAQLTLPVNFLEFNARRENNDGVISWSVGGEDANSDYYEIERSIDGTSFQSIAHINCRKLPGLQKYEYTDKNITSLNSKYVYYRIRQYDLDAKFVLSNVRQLKMDISDKGVAMYPNPVKSGFYLNIPFAHPDQSKVSLTIMNGVGQIVDTKQITSQQATNYYYDLRNAHLTGGNYYLKIIHDDSILDIKKFLISKE